MTYIPPTIPVGLKTANPSLTDVLNAHKIDIFQTLNCHAIATITQVNLNLNNNLVTVNAQVNYSRTSFKRQSNGKYQPVLQPYPLLVDCPVLTLAGGNTGIVVPIAVGDQCLIMFNDRDMNNWFANPNTGGELGTMQPPTASARQHSFSDAIALVGFLKVSLVDTIPPQYLNNIALTNGNAIVGLPNTTTLPDSGRVLITNLSSGNTLGQALSQLIVAIENITVSAGSFTAPSGGGPVTGTSGTVVDKTALEDVRSLIDQLLE